DRQDKDGDRVIGIIQDPSVPGIVDIDIRGEPDHRVKNERHCTRDREAEPSHRVASGLGICSLVATPAGESPSVSEHRGSYQISPPIARVNRESTRKSWDLPRSPSRP